MCLLRDPPLRAIPLAAPCCSAAQSAANRRKLKTPQTWSPKELGYLNMFPTSSCSPGWNYKTSRIPGRVNEINSLLNT